MIAALLVPAGNIADIVGRKKLFFIGLWTFLGASVLCALAPSVPFLVAARVIQAVGAAIVVPTSLGLMLPEFPPAKRATATAIWSASGAIAAATGPSLGGVLVDQAGWRWVFLVNLLIGIPAVIPARRLLIERRDETAGSLPDAVGVAQLVPASACSRSGIVQGPDWGWGSAEVVGSLIAGVGLLAAFALRSARTRAGDRARSCSGSALSPSPASGLSCSSSRFYALLSSTSCSSRRSGATRP